jgi:hypothetical protein
MKLFFEHIQMILFYQTHSNEIVIHIHLALRYVNLMKLTYQKATVQADDGILRLLSDFRNHLQVMVYVDSELLLFLH